MMTSQTTIATDTAACLGHAELFLHPLFDQPAHSLSAQQAHQVRTMVAQAERLCQACPIAERCLYQAVVKHDVAGYVAGTTPGQRLAMRARLGWRVEQESFDAFVGVSSGRQVSHDEIMRLRKAYPNKTLEDIADRLGCSLSTVKRHLRQAREGTATADARPVLAPVPPSSDQVLAARRDVLGGRTQQERRLVRAA